VLRFLTKLEWHVPPRRGQTVSSAPDTRLTQLGTGVPSDSIICVDSKGLSLLSSESSESLESSESSESLSKSERNRPGESLKNRSQYDRPDCGMVELSIGDAIFVVLAGEKQDLALYEDWREWPRQRTHHPALNNEGGKSP
jgi:hypothetical protein